MLPVAASGRKWELKGGEWTMVYSKPEVLELGNAEALIQSQERNVDLEIGNDGTSPSYEVDE